MDYIVLIVSALPQNRGKISNNLTVQATRHLHYLPLTEFSILQYCCRLILTGIKVRNNIFIYIFLDINFWLFILFNFHLSSRVN